MERLPQAALLLLFLLVWAPARAQVTHDPQIWTAVAGNAKLGEGKTGPALWLDAHLRRSGGGTLHIFRPGVGYRYKGWLSGWAGYGWIPSLPDEGDTLHEHRLWQQLILTRTDEGVSLQLRSRFEQRFADSGDDVGFRLREFVRMGWSWRKDRKYGLVAWDEVFLGFNETDWGAPSGFDQNRFFTGFFAKSGKKLRLELGYLSLYLDRDPEDTVGHVLATNVFVSF